MNEIPQVAILHPRDDGSFTLDFQDSSQPITRASAAREVHALVSLMGYTLSQVRALCSIAQRTGEGYVFLPPKKRVE